MRFKNTHIDLNSTKPRNLFITITPAMTQQKKKLESLDRSNFAIKSIKKKKKNECKEIIYKNSKRY